MAVERATAPAVRVPAPSSGAPGQGPPEALARVRGRETLGPVASGAWSVWRAAVLRAGCVPGALAVLVFTGTAAGSLQRVSVG